MIATRSQNRSTTERSCEMNSKLPPALTQFELPDEPVRRHRMVFRQPGLHLGWIVLVPIEIVVGVERATGRSDVEDLMRVEVGGQVVAWNKNIRLRRLGMPSADCQCRPGQGGELPS